MCCEILKVKQLNPFPGLVLWCWLNLAPVRYDKTRWRLHHAWLTQLLDRYKNPKKKLSTLSEFIMFLFAVMVCGRFVEIEMQDEGWTFWFILFLIFWGQQIEQPLSSSNIMPGRMLASPKPLLFKESNSSQALLDVQFHKSKEKCFDVDVRTECV